MGLFRRDIRTISLESFLSRLTNNIKDTHIHVLCKNLPTLI